MAKLFLSQCIRSGATVHMLQGDSITLVLPSGKKINIEVTDDTTSIAVEGNSLFTEVLDRGDWRRDHQYKE